MKGVIYMTSKKKNVNSGIYYDGITFGITKEGIDELNRGYNASVLGCSLEEYNNMIREHESEYELKHKNKSKKRRFWGKSVKYPY